jgi:hypothetical protein
MANVTDRHLQQQTGAQMVGHYSTQPYRRSSYAQMVLLLQHASVQRCSTELATIALLKRCTARLATL